MSLLKWSTHKNDDPLYHIAKSWIAEEKVEIEQLIKGLQRISEITHSEIYRYNNFELMTIRNLLINSLTDCETCDLNLVEHSLNPDKTFDLLDGLYVTITILICLGVGWIS